MAKRIKVRTRTGTRGITDPSSTRKKLVKEGNRKFIGPRSLRSQLTEDREHAVGSNFPNFRINPRRNFGTGNVRGAKYKERSDPVGGVFGVKEFGSSIGSDELKERLFRFVERETKRKLRKAKFG